MSSNEKSVGKIYQLIPKAMKEIGAIGKNGTNAHQKYKFRSIDDMYNKIQPVLADLGICFIPQILDTKEESFDNKNNTRSIRVKLRVKYTIYADDSSSIESITEGEAIDTSDKATNKALTAAFKYMLIQVFCIAIEGDDDADASSPEIGRAKPRQTQNQPTTAKPEPKKEVKLEDYVVPFGKFKGQKFSSLDIFELNNYVEWVIDKANHDGKTIQGQVKDFIDHAEAYLCSREVVPPELDLGQEIAQVFVKKYCTSLFCCTVPVKGKTWTRVKNRTPKEVDERETKCPDCGSELINLKMNRVGNNTGNRIKFQCSGDPPEIKALG